MTIPSHPASHIPRHEVTWEVVTSDTPSLRRGHNVKRLFSSCLNDTPLKIHCCEGNKHADGTWLRDRVNKQLLLYIIVMNEVNSDLYGIGTVPYANMLPV